MVRKREVFFVVLSLFLITITCVNTLGFEVNEAGKKTSFAVGCAEDKCGDEDVDDLICGTTNEFDCIFFGYGQVIDNIPHVDETGDNGCTVDLYDPKFKVPADQGCWVFGAYEVNGQLDDCALLRSHTGFKITYRNYFSWSINSYKDNPIRYYYGVIDAWDATDGVGDPDEDAGLKGENMLYEEWILWNQNQEYICGSDNYWHMCDGTKSGSLDTFTWVILGDNLLHIFQCKVDGNDLPYWEDIGVDGDQDGYTPEMGDCYDDKSKDPSFCSDLKIPDDCGSVESYQCAICINPGAPEVCGDKINNDCGGSEDPNEMEKYDNLEGETDNDCDKNQESCTQQPGEIRRMKQAKLGGMCRF